MSLTKSKGISSSAIGHFALLTLKPHSQISLVGLSILFIFGLQLISGTMIAFSLNCDPMNIPQSRNEEDSEDLYTDDFF